MKFKTRYSIILEENSQYQDNKSRRETAGFDNVDEAECAAKMIVDDFLLLNFQPGMSESELFELYIQFGEDPYIIGGPPESDFSAWKYAELKCKEFCSK